MTETDLLTVAMEATDAYAAFVESPHPTFKHTTYFHVYEELFAKYRGKPVTFVEVGILDGGSLFMWRKFFGQSARIIGIDLNPKAKKWESDGFEIFIGSQSDPSFWESFCSDVGAIDILLDDGGHTYLQQIVTSEMMLDQITDGGMLVVEDMHTSYMDGFGDRKLSFRNYVHAWMDKLNSRFGKFPKIQSDRRVWSVFAFESIVAFNVDRSKSMLVSAPIRNRQPVEGAEDYRHHPENKLEENKAAIQDLVAQAFTLYKE